jgi:hypothetical protein
MRPLVAVAILASLPLSAAVADVYRSIDAQGHVLYSDTYTPGAQLIKTDAQSHLNMAVANPSPGVAKPSSPPPKGADSTDQATRDAATKAVQADVAQTHADQCKKAQDYYQQIIQARRVYSSDSSGQRQYMSDADAEQARIDAKLQMDTYCKDQPAAASTPNP